MLTSSANTGSSIQFERIAARDCEAKASLKRNQEVLCSIILTIVNGAEIEVGLKMLAILSSIKRY